jgi:hypothetical protein
MKTLRYMLFGLLVVMGGFDRLKQHWGNVSKNGGGK